MTKPLTETERKHRSFQKLRAGLGYGEYPEPRRVDRDDVFRILCEWQAAISPVPERIMSVRRIADAFGATEYNVRKCIKELQADGLVKVGHLGGMDEDGMVHCTHGFGLTAKGCETETYKAIDRETMEEMERFLNESHERWLAEEAF